MVVRTKAFTETIASKLHSKWDSVSYRTKEIIRAVQFKRILLSNSTITVPKEMAETGTDILLRANEQRHILFRELSAGHYKLRVTNNTGQVPADKSGIVVKVSTSLNGSEADCVLDTGTEHAEGGRQLLFSNSGAEADDYMSQYARFQLTEDSNWIFASISSNSQSPANTVNIGIAPDVVDLETDQADLSIYVSRMLREQPDFADAEFVLYADISLNVVDGSSVWLSSMLSALAANGKTLVISKQDIQTDIIWSNVKNRHNVLLLSPAAFGVEGQTISTEAAINLIRELDAASTNIRRVIVRGLKAALMLCEDRQFAKRSCIYLTDFYEIEEGQLTVSPAAQKAVSTIATQAGYLLTQTKLLGQKIEALAGLSINCQSFPPPIPDNLPRLAIQEPLSGPLKIGYAGKVTPNWGVDELIDWTSRISEGGIETELHIVANRISDGVGKKRVAGFAKSIRDKMQRSGSVHYADLNRDSSMRKMAEMDFVWCYRPPALEDNTLEVSTKLIEMVGAGAACICYPSTINLELLGDDYPFFVRDYAEFAQIVKSGPKPLSGELVSRIKKTHSLTATSARLKKTVLGKTFVTDDAPTVVVAGHDFKFIDPFISYLKAVGQKVYRDRWEWGGPANLQSSIELQANADIILCEWGLANAVWHSQNKREGTTLVVRVHLQEINARAKKFGFKINKEAVDSFVFVEEGVRRTAIEMFGIPEEKTQLIPNFILDDEYRSHAEDKHNGETIRLGMVGITPQRKRLDVAVELLAELINTGQHASLAIKGPRPEELDFMHAPGRVEELEYYNGVYARIESDERLANAVSFAPWGNDVAEWYRGIDFILSPSDFESFHYALADGVLSGCSPLIWPWKGADEIYDPNWILADVEQAVAKIDEIRRLPSSERVKQAHQNRTLLVEKFGYAGVFDRLSDCLGLNQHKQ